ncbi:hypothetical protein ACS2E9_03725 [Bacillus cereus group sp. BceL215]|uniref:hypothetical protein n=1 Tax=Bacillus cereus group TaxID=86661 RepID=UPI000BF6E953|nr:hypothetical protein [Bacillus toyonensis]PFY74026.1 hypothetical protein COL46_07530 [Bacillus toyonensis]HDR7414089.1 hypothetical protein [Bacillus toyonensis]
MFQEKEYFFCYSTNLHDFLRYEKGLRFICTAIHDKTYKRFWLFEKTEEFTKALIEYRINGEKNAYIKD